MMRTILVPLAQDLAAEPALEAAFAVAKRMNSHIRGMFVRPDLNVASRYVPDMIAAAGVTREAIEQEGRRLFEAERSRFADWQSRHEIPSSPAIPRPDSFSASWVERVGEIEKIITHYGRLSDLIVMSQFKPNNVMAARCFDAAVFASGRPTLVVPEKHTYDITEHVMIAWNGSLEATRAVAGAMPLLHLAKRVSIFTAIEFGPEAGDLTDLGEALSWHGIRTPEVFFPKDGQPAGSALLAAANKQGATMIVMGAYTHSRLRQSFLGGVTKRVLTEATIPFLMSH